MERINDDTYVLSYKAIVDGACTSGGKTEKQLSPVRAATVWIRSGQKWQAVFHGENPIVDPKALSESSNKEGSEKGDPKRVTATLAGSAKRIDSSDSAGLLAAEGAVWRAWKEKNAKQLEQLTAAELTFVNIFGTYFSTKAGTIKDWTGTTCYVKSFALTDGVETLVSPTVGIVTVTGWVDGDCGGQKPPPVYGVSVYVKDGGTWKWAFGFNSPH